MGFNNGDNKLAELANSGSNGDFDSLHQHIRSSKFREDENVSGVCSGTFKDFPCVPSSPYHASVTAAVCVYTSPQYPPM